MKSRDEIIDLLWNKYEKYGYTLGIIYTTEEEYNDYGRLVAKYTYNYIELSFMNCKIIK